jgi:hypothetical protein
MASVPPRSDLASPIDDSCTSTRFPERANGGRVAVTTTAAAFFTRICRGSTEICTPRRRSMFKMLCTVKSACCPSPVPSRPTTTP